jgi:excisionase family DNA binding protein
MSQLLTVQQAAEKLGVTVSTVHRYEARGLLRPHFRTLGGHRRYRLEDVLSIRDRNKKGLS